MSILGMWGEDIDFPNGAAVTVATNTTYFRSGYARCAVRSTAGALCKSTVLPGGAVTSFWFTARFRSHPPSSSRMFGVGKSGTNAGLFIGVDTTSTKLALWKSDGTTHTKLASESGTSFTHDTLHRLDLQVTSFGASATVNVYLNGVLTITYSGDVTVTGMSNVDSVVLLEDDTYCSEMIVADEDTRTFSLVTLAPNGAGTGADPAQLTGAYTDIDELTANDADAVYSNSSTHESWYHVSDLPAGTFTVKAVKIAARASTSAGASATKLEPGWANGTTSNTTFPGTSLTTAWQTVERYDATDPHTGSAWTQANLNSNRQIAFKVRS